MESMEVQGSPSQNELLALETYDVEELLWRPSISDLLRVGAFKRENATQTDVTEVLELKELTNVIQNVVKSMDDLKKDVILQKSILRAEHEQKIQAQAVELYGRMNDAVRDLEAVHKKKVSNLRRSFQMQLINALAVIKAKYEHNPSDSNGINSSHSASSVKIDALKKKLDEQETLIQSLNALILEMEENEQPKQIVFESEDDPEKERLLEENREMKEEVDALQGKIEQLENGLRQKEKHIQMLDLDVGSMKQKMEKDQKTIEKLSSEQDNLNSVLEEKSAAIAQLQHQKEEAENIMKTKLTEKEREQTRIQQEHEARLREHGNKVQEDLQKQRQLLLLETEQLKKMQKQQLIPKAPKADVANLSADKEQLLTQIKKLTFMNEDQEKSIERLRRELERVNKAWEKKFEILKHSFHAIKDEMFLRQSLHRQAMNLHRVSVSYMEDGRLVAPTTRLPAKQNFCFPTLPLPQIGARPPSPMQMSHFTENYVGVQEEDLFTDNELQVVSDDTEGNLEGFPTFLPPVN
ncbi:Hypothetical predicted protein [Pelobates cultripes]|uniref:DUF4709 domain-containing protein n=2 Tax=Pelobates cultripes TaxID=61616 RepID=A0AAD1RZS2_PELCU|nr:Hypothetical predicted protein [Pelobates cultripes]